MYDIVRVYIYIYIHMYDIVSIHDTIAIRYHKYNIYDICMNMCSYHESSGFQKGNIICEDQTEANRT